MFTIKKPRFAYTALEPYIDARTIEIHTDKHHQGYADKLNKTLEPYPELQAMPLEKILSEPDQLPANDSDDILNFAGGVHNHDLFWQILSPDHDQEVPEKLQTAIEATFNSFEDFKSTFSTEAASLFGSGWAWLVKQINSTTNPELFIITTPNQDSPLSHGYVPLMGLDVWEHAYYLKYQNKRADYIEAFWHLIDWADVSRRFQTPAES